MSAVKIPTIAVQTLPALTGVDAFQASLRSSSVVTAHVLQQAVQEGRRHVLGHYAGALFHLEFRPRTKEYAAAESDSTAAADNHLATAGYSRTRTAIELRTELVARASDSLTMARQQSRAPSRNDLIRRVVDSASVERGLKIFKAALPSSKNEFREKLESVKDLAEVAPWITTYDLLVLSLLEAPPASLTAALASPDLAASQCNLHRLDLDGALFSKFEMRIEEENQDSPESELGINKPSDNFEHKRYTRDVRLLLFGAAASGITDAEVYRRLFSREPSTEVFLAGYGKLLDCALVPEVVKRLDAGVQKALVPFLELKQKAQAEGRTASLKELIKEAGLGEGKLTASAGRLLREAFGHLEVMDLSSPRPHSYSGVQLAEMAGLLAYVPNCLVPGASRAIYFRPLGKGLEFCDARGKILEYVPFAPFQQIDAEIELRQAVVDDRFDNESVAATIECLSQGLRKKLDAMENVTVLEQCARDFKQRFRLQLPIYPRPYLGEGSVFGDDLTHMHRLNLIEVAAIDTAMRRLDPPLAEFLLSEIYEVKKELAGGDSVEDLTRGSFTRAQFGDHAVTLRQRSGVITDTELLGDETVKALYHELGHNLWIKLSKEQQDQFARLFRTKMDRSELRVEFVSAYARTSAEEDFCETFGTVIASGGAFFSKFADRPGVLAKGNVIKELLEAKLEGVDLNAIPEDIISSRADCGQNPYLLPVPRDSLRAQLEMRLLELERKQKLVDDVDRIVVPLGVGSELEEQMDALQTDDLEQFEDLFHRMQEEVSPDQELEEGERKATELLQIEQKLQKLNAEGLESAVKMLTKLTTRGDVNLVFVEENGRIEGLSLAGSGVCNYRSDIAAAAALRPLLEAAARIGCCSISLRQGADVKAFAADLGA